MEQSKLEKDNILLAEFVGGKLENELVYGVQIVNFEKFNKKPIIHKKGKYLVAVSELKFHKDWNWIYVVIEKLNEKIHQISDLNYFEGYVAELSDLLVSHKIKEVFDYLVVEIRKI